MTEIEGKYLSREKVSIDRLSLVDWFLFALFIAALLFLGLTVEKTIIDPYLRAQEVNAAELTETDYCQMISAGTKVTGASFEEIRSHCARFNVSL